METQRSPEWFEKRKGRVTGSNAGAILGCDPYRKPKDVMRAMVRAFHGAESEFNGNVATEHGVFYEEYAQAAYEMEHECTVTETGFWEYADWLGSSPDGIVSEYVVLEIKCPFGIRNDTDPVFKTIAEMPHYYAQTQLEMLCTGSEDCHFYQWAPHGSSLEIVRYDGWWISENLPKLREFYEQFLIECENPDKHLGAKVKTLKNSSTAERYKETKAMLDEVKKELDKLKAQLVIDAGGEKSSIGGLLIYPIDRKGSIPYAKILKEHFPEFDVEPYRGESSTTWAVK